MNDPRDSVSHSNSTSETLTWEQSVFLDCLKRRQGNENDDVACVHFFLSSSPEKLPFRAPKAVFTAIESKAPAVRRIDVAVDPDAKGFESVERFVRYGLPVTVLFRGWGEGGPQHFERRLAWPPGDEEDYMSVTDWVKEFLDATNSKDGAPDTSSSSNSSSLSGQELGCE